MVKLSKFKKFIHHSILNAFDLMIIALEEDTIEFSTFSFKTTLSFKTALILVLCFKSLRKGNDSSIVTFITYLKHIFLSVCLLTLQTSLYSF